MERNELTANIRDQEDQATLAVTAFDKEKPVAMQQQVLEGITQHRSFNSACYKVKSTYQRDQWRDKS